MVDDGRTSKDGLARRDLIAVGAAAALGAGLAGMADAQVAVHGTTAPGPVPANAKPGRIVLERRGDILLIGLDRAAVQNRLDAPMLIGLGKAYYQLDQDDGLRVGVLHALGPDFSMGLDVPAFQAAQAAGILPVKDADYINPFAFAPPFRAKPLVVAVQGGVWYGAHEIFLASDIRVAASDATFSQGEITRGLFPGGGGTVRFPREAGWGNAMRYMLTGDTWGAEEAHRMGLVQEITPVGGQLDRALEIAKKVAACAPIGARAVIASAHQAIASEEPALAAVRGNFVKLFATEDFQEARRALQEGRGPIFHGN